MSTRSKIKVWDPLIRVFHWSLVSGFIIAFVTEDEWLNLHVYAGYTILGLLAIRLLWGFVGTRYARFTDFVRPPREALRYVKGMLSPRSKRYLGHNPAGGLMILALLISLSITSISGLVTYGIEGFGPLADWLHSHGVWNDEGFEEAHEFFANFSLGLVGIHLAGVLLGSLAHGENLVRAMFTGFKQR
jgi:cytochrome b